MTLGNDRYTHTHTQKYAGDLVNWAHKVFSFNMHSTWLSNIQIPLIHKAPILPTLPTTTTRTATATSTILNSIHFPLPRTLISFTLDYNKWKSILKRKAMKMSNYIDWADFIDYYTIRFGMWNNFSFSATWCREEVGGFLLLRSK